MIVPADFTYPARKTRVAHLSARMLALLCVRRRVVVQAGGCAGLWPLALARYFGRVYTFEPAPANLACLRANVAGQASITVFGCAVGDRTASVGLTRTVPKAGHWEVSGEGSVPMVRLDDVVCEGPVDAVVLDVEGSEVSALRGAMGILARDRPLVWVEMRRDRDALRAILAEAGYHAWGRGMGSDWWVRHGRVR